MDWSRLTTRKFLAATGTCALIFIGWLMTNWMVGLRENFGSMVTGLVSALTVFLTGNVVQDHFMNRPMQQVVVNQRIDDPSESDYVDRSERY